jgi:hypothetical protein
VFPPADTSRVLIETMQDSNDSKVLVPQTAGSDGSEPPTRRTPSTAGESGGGLKAGQRVDCVVVCTSPGGYLVTIPKLKSDGFLPAEYLLKPGQHVVASFVCYSNNRMLLHSSKSRSRKRI